MKKTPKKTTKPKGENQDTLLGDENAGIGACAAGGGIVGALIGGALAGPIGAGVGALGGSVVGGIAQNNVADADSTEKDIRTTKTRRSI